MIYVCPRCSALHEMGADHRDEPCVNCWREGWRLDGCGNLYRVPIHQDQDPLAPARGIVFGSALALLFFWIPLLLVAIWVTA